MTVRFSDISFLLIQLPKTSRSDRKLQTPSHRSNITLCVGFDSHLYSSCQLHIIFFLQLWADGHSCFCKYLHQSSFREQPQPNYRLLPANHLLLPPALSGNIPATFHNTLANNPPLQVRSASHIQETPQSTVRFCNGSDHVMAALHRSFRPRQTPCHVNFCNASMFASLTQQSNCAIACYKTSSPVQSHLLRSLYRPVGFFANWKTISHYSALVIRYLASQLYTEFPPIYA